MYRVALVPAYLTVTAGGLPCSQLYNQDFVGVPSDRITRTQSPLVIGIYCGIEIIELTIATHALVLYVHCLDGSTFSVRTGTAVDKEEKSLSQSSLSRI